MNLDASKSSDELKTATLTSREISDENDSSSSDPTVETPEILIEPGNSGFIPALQDLWRYRELLYFLTWRDVKLRYKQTALGAAWAIIQPLFTMLLFTLFFGRLARIHSEGIPYPLFAYAGLLPWTFFANALTNSGNSLVGNSTLITKVYFPRMIIPAAAVLAGLLDFLIAFLLLIPMLIYYRIAMSWSLLFLPLFIALATLLALGVGMWFAALNVKYRDIRYALPFLVQLWLFASPVIYPSSIMPERWRWLLALNPMTGIIEGFRASLFGGKLDLAMTLTSAALTIAILIVSLFVFQYAEDSFADVV